MRLDPLERLDIRVRHALDDALVLGDPVSAHVDRDEGVVTAKSSTGQLGGPKIDEDLRVPCLEEARDRRLGRHAGVDRSLLDGGDEGVTGTDGDRRELIGRDPFGAGEVLRETVRARADRGHAELAPLEVGRTFDVVRLGGRDHLGLTRRTQELHHLDQVLTKTGHVDGVVVRAGRALDLAGDERRRRVLP